MKKERLRKKKRNSGITLVALVVTIVVLLILAGITISTLFGDNGIINKAREAADATNKAQKDTEEGLDNLKDQLAGALGEQNKAGYNENEGMNSPKIKGEMVPVRWNEQEKAWYVCSSENTNKEWYDYENHLWANIMLRDGLVIDNGTEAGQEVTKDTKLEDIIGKKVKSVGSMFVWIPRYAYQITSGYHTNVAGEIKVEFLQGSTDIPAKDNVKIVEYNSETTEEYTKFPDGYVVHPAFKYGSHTTGLWIAKFEASKQGATADISNENVANNDKIDITLQVKPSVTSWRYITEPNMYTVCINYRSELNSHQMKNTEWGAIAYLAQSKYGRNGTEISQNQCTAYITGAGPGAGESTISNTKYEYDETTFESTYSYTSTQGKLSSSTGNVTGIYDLSGGANDRVASCLETYTDFASKDSKTVDIYKVGDPNDTLNNYEANKDKYGDAVWETSSTTSNSSSFNSWNGDYSYFLHGTNYFFHRGGLSGTTGIYAGLFAFQKINVVATAGFGFRPVLVVF